MWHPQIIHGVGVSGEGVTVCIYLLTRSEAVEREQVLRTRAMRERDDMRNMVRYYRYTLLRIRMPDGLLLQGKNLYIFFTSVVLLTVSVVAIIAEQEVRQVIMQCGLGI